jgi:molybdopterin converting factor small subunit
VAAITVGLPAAISAPAPARDVTLHADTVGEALRALVAESPQLESRVFYRGRLLVLVTLNGRQLPPSRAEATVVSAGDRLDLVTPVAGG